MKVSPKHWGEDPIHQTLISGANILKAKGHDLVAVVGELGHKGCLALVHLVHTNMILP